MGGKRGIGGEPLDSHDYKGYNFDRIPYDPRDQV